MQGYVLSSTMNTLVKGTNLYTLHIFINLKLHLILILKPSFKRFKFGKKFVAIPIESWMEKNGFHIKFEY